MCTNKSYILLKFSILIVRQLLMYNQHIHNLFAIFAIFLDICKQFSTNLINSHGNSPFGSFPTLLRFVVASLSFIMESIGVDSENYLFAKLCDYSEEMLHLI